jgi:hypothetical protein
MNKFQRICLLWAIFNLLILTTACGDWIAQATNIINMLVPAINAALALLMAFGVGISPDVQAAVQKWSAEAVDTLTNVVKPLLDELKTAVDSAKPGILDKIQAAVQVIADDLSNILPSIHVTSPATQAKIVAVFQLVLAQIVALVNVIPAFHPNSSLSMKTKKKLVNAVMEPEDFRQEFNDLTEEFGTSYTI